MFKKLALMLVFPLLASCGGGGDGDDGGSFSIYSDRAALSLSFYEGEGIPNETISIRGRGELSGPIYIGGGWSGDGIKSVLWEGVDDRVDFHVEIAPGLTQGTHAGKIVVASRTIILALVVGD
ncbi:hypothetical protein, partial [Chitinolyticbacter albus]|uniref:hypothetical protein n=1 Tax=Chitinolyticbacter albus TaxID=2961951 RepID=UPI00210DAA68